jgi:ABC transport system ATP-binding/permease protein
MGWYCPPCGRRVVFMPSRLRKKRTGWRSRNKQPGAVGRARRDAGAAGPGTWPRSHGGDSFPRMNVLNVQDLHKSYGTRVVFAGVSFAVDEGEKLGFIGANGSGKSTLFRIVAGLEGTERGALAFRRGARVGYLAQDPHFQPGLTIRQAVAGGSPELQQALDEHHALSAQLADAAADTARLLARHDAVAARIEALGGWDWEHRVEAMLTRVGLDHWEREVEGLSGGERKRVALARTLLEAPDLLLLDEPTNHLDVETVQWLEEHLQDYAGAVMLITHDRYFLDRVVTRMLEVSAGELTPYAGGYTEYLEQKAERETREAAEQGKRAKLIQQELAWVRRSPSARRTKQQARIDRLGALQAEQRAKQPPALEVAEMRFGRPPRLGRTVLDLHHLSKRFGDVVLIDDFSTQLRAGERIGVVGPNGAGKTTLLRLILGEQSPTGGEVVLGQNTRIAYFDQARQDLDPDASIYEAVADTDFVTVGGQRLHLHAYLENFLFSPAVQRQRVRSLSGGERSRVLLARLFLQEANLLILDEPTNDLDLVTLQVLESALVDFPGCVLMVTHDRFFLDKIATGLIVFEGAGVVRRHEGGYDLYRRLREKREAERAAAVPPASASKPATKTAAPGRPRKLSYKEQRELDSMEDHILEAEERREALAERLADPGLYADGGVDVAGLSAEFEAATARVDALYARWAELEKLRTG